MPWKLIFLCSSEDKGEEQLLTLLKFSCDSSFPKMLVMLRMVNCSNKQVSSNFTDWTVRRLVVTHSSLKWTLLVLPKCCDVIVIGTHQAHCRESQTPDTSLWFCDTYSLRPVSISLYHVHSHGDLREQPAPHSVDVARLQYKWPKIEVIEYVCVGFF